VTQTDDFESFVTLAWSRLLRSAWLLTGDWHRAEDLVQTALVRVHGRWSRIRDGAPEAYVRTVIATTYLNWQRRRWRNEIPFETVPDAAGTDPHAGTDLREAMRAALRGLPPRQRAVLMLRYHGDLTEAATADALGLSVGTVKSYTARALAALRVDPRLRAILAEGALA
jgi:RNA polymerase sigma-70 factor (sigma-E family)